MSKKIKVLDIYLDSDNPRHEKKSDQTDIIFYLLQNDRIKNLAKDIAEKGMSPIELLAVVKDKNNKYIVVEGNRRICALTLLNDPDKAPNQNLKDYFRKLKANSSYVPDTVNCQVFDSREDAALWIERRHIGEQDGVGTRQWNATQKTRFNTSQSKKDSNALAQSILDYAIKYQLMDDTDTNGILTTASRFLGNPYFRETLGIVSSRSDANVKIKVSFNEFDTVITRFCTDLIESSDVDSPNISVTSRANAKEIKAYSQRLVQEGLAPLTHVVPHFLSDKTVLQDKEDVDDFDVKEVGGSDTSDVYGTDIPDVDGTDIPDVDGTDTSDVYGTDIPDVDGTDTSDVDVTDIPDVDGTDTSDVDGTDIPDVDGTDTSDVEGTTATTSGQPGTTKNPDNRKTLLSSKMSGCISDKILRRVYTELRNIDITENPLAVMLVARAFLEGIYIRYYELETNKTVASGMKIHLVLLGLIKELEKKKETLTKVQKNAFAALKKLPHDQTKIFAAGNLGVYAHAAEYPSNAKQIIVEWDNIYEIVQYMLVELYKAGQ